MEQIGIDRREFQFDPTIAMRSWHSHVREQLAKDANEETQEKLMMINYLSGLSLDTQTVNIPSTFLLPVLKPSSLEADRCKDVAYGVSVPYY